MAFGLPLMHFLTMGELEKQFVHLGLLGIGQKRQGTADLLQCAIAENRLGASIPHHHLAAGIEVDDRQRRGVERLGQHAGLMLQGRFGLFPIGGFAAERLAGGG